MAIMQFDMGLCRPTYDLQNENHGRNSSLLEYSLHFPQKGINVFLTLMTGCSHKSNTLQTYESLSTNSDLDLLLHHKHHFILTVYSKIF